MIDIEKIKGKCCGCMACKNICPAGCIKTIIDTEGFYYPHIDREKCLGCGLCEKVCILEQSFDDKNDLKACWVKNKDTDKIMKSSSGGAFAAFAEKIIAENGVVFGAIFDEYSKTIKHDSNVNTSLEKLKKSKYCESNINMTYLEIKKLLDSNRKVMFVGTPCQCSALVSFLGEKPDDLLIVDFVCHGVPSVLCMQEYIKHQEKRNKSKVINIDMRPKDNGWNKMQIKIFFENGEKSLLNAITDIYMSNFFNNVFLRKSCYNCKFALNHNSDITLADFWGYKAYDFELNKDNIGISLVVFNTKKGMEFFDFVKEKVDFGIVPYDKFGYIYQRNNFEYDISIREKFMKKAKKAGILKTMKSYRNRHVINALKAKIFRK